MLRKLLLVLIVLAFLPFQMKADWVSIDKNNTSNSAPKITLLSDDSDGIVIKVDISGFDLKEFNEKGKLYQSVDLLTEMFSTNPGHPEVPYIAEVLAIPDQAGVSVEVLNTGEIHTFENINLPPSRLSWIEGEAESSYEENSKAYQSSDIYPKEFAEIGSPSVFRDFRIARVSVFPVRYIPASKELQVASSITVRINYGKGDESNPKTTERKPIAPSFGKLYRSFIFNYQNVLDNYYGGKEKGHELMLCIMPDIFEESFQAYAEWNRQSGTNIHVTKFSDIDANSNNPNIIKNHISDAYFNWEVPPTYVLIIGDDGVFPKKIVNYDYSFANEDYFVELDGDDFFPEMMIGRFTNQGDYRMQVIINKLLKYETEPYTADTDWFKEGVCCSNNEYDSQVATKRFAASVMTEDGGFTVDTLMSDGYWGNGCSMDEGDVVNIINDGRSYLNYRGEGWSDGWNANCYNFHTSHVASLNNGEKFTFVTSIGCGVAMFDSNGDNCFGEKWLELGSLSEPRGGVAFVGPTSNTHTTYNNKIDKGIYAGMFQEGMDTPGQALLRGKLYMFNVYGNDYWVEYHYRVYCILGDPSIHIWKEVPLDVNVDHPTSIVVGSNQVEVTTTHSSNGQPVFNAQVCISGDGVFASAFSDSTGLSIVEVAPALEEPLIITVRGGDVIPYQGTIDVTQPGEHVEPFGDPLIVDLDGNTDGLVNPNENCDITFTLKNWGAETSNNIEATLTSNNEDYIEIVTTNSIGFGSLDPGDTFTGDPFQFYITHDCPIGEIVSMHLNVTSNTTTWDYDIDVEIQGCELFASNFVIVDEGAIDMNYRMDPGETVKLIFSVDNLGMDYANNVSGILSSNDQYITIIDSIGSFGTIDTSSVSINSDNYYVVSVDETCPAEYMAEYSLKLFTQNGNYPYELISILSIPVSMAIPNDYTGPDSYGYYAYCSSDGFYEQTPVYEWYEIDTLGTEIEVPNISDFTTTVYLPFTFQYYGIDYNQIRISTDGWAAFGSGNQIAPTNTSLPNNDNVSNMVAVFWDDFFDLDETGEDIIYLYDNVNNRFIIEWQNVSHNADENDPERESFQLVLLDPEHYPTVTGDGEIICQYLRVENTESNTIGIEDNSQTIGLQYVYDQDYDATASTLVVETAIKFTTEPPFYYLETGFDDEYLDNSQFPANFSLEQNHPNPFSSYTSINYSLPAQSNVTLSIYNASGEIIRTLQNGNQKAGRYTVKWNGLNEFQNQVSPGIYFYRLQTDDYSKTLKLLMLK